MEERKYAEPRPRYLLEVLLPCRLPEPTSDHGIGKQRLEAGRHISAVVFERVKGGGRLELPPRESRVVIVHDAGATGGGRESRP